MNNSGFFLVQKKNIEKIKFLFESSNYKIYNLPENMLSKDEFFDGVRQTLPLDPPLISNKSWDALDDSLWSGLESIPERNILIIWPSADKMKEHESNIFNIVSTIFEALPNSLSKSKDQGGGEKKLVIVGII